MDASKMEVQSGKYFMYALGGLVIAFVIYMLMKYAKENYTDLDYTPPLTNPPAVPLDPEAQQFVETIDELDLSEDLLIPGNNIGINTVQNSKRNPNLQLRADPVIPLVETGPWNNSTLITHLQKKPLGE